MAGRFIYINGQYVERRCTCISAEDRGYQFADGVYEVFPCVNGELWDFREHMERLYSSLAAIRIFHSPDMKAFELLVFALLRKNRLESALVYIQITRGTAMRAHAFPPDTGITTVISTYPFDAHEKDRQAEKGIQVLSQPDIRWGRADIKSISLLPNVLAKQAAAESGCSESWLVRNNTVTEGTSSNAWILDADGTLVTHGKDRSILGGITRERIAGCAVNLGIPFREAAFTVGQAKSAREAFISSATNTVMPVISIDGTLVGNGKPGPVTLMLRKDYAEKVSRLRRPDFRI